MYHAKGGWHGTCFCFSAVFNRLFAVFMPCKKGLKNKALFFGIFIFWRIFIFRLNCLFPLVIFCLLFLDFVLGFSNVVAFGWIFMFAWDFPMFLQAEPSIKLRQRVSRNNAPEKQSFSHQHCAHVRIRKTKFPKKRALFASAVRPCASGKKSSGKKGLYSLALRAQVSQEKKVLEK